MYLVDLHHRCPNLCIRGVHNKPVDSTSKLLMCMCEIKNTPTNIPVCHYHHSPSATIANDMSSLPQ